MISTKEVDYLEQDPEIRNQNYYCMSIINPEEVLKRKEAYHFEQFTKHYVEKNNELLKGLETLFPDKSDTFRSIKESYNMLFDTETINENFTYFVKENEDQLNKSFDSENNYQTSTRGIKIRGVYNSIEEAQKRCDVLKKIDHNKFYIYIGQVGCWCPMNINPEQIENPEYAETQLNTLMFEYNKNIDKKDEFYKMRKQELRERIEKNEVEKQKTIDENTNSTLIDDDPWIKSQVE